MGHGVLSIRWAAGDMDIIMDRFFPCTAQRFKKLLKIIDLDWGHCDTLKETLKVYFQQQIPALKEQRVQLAAEYADQKQAVSDLETLVKTRKKPVGVYLTKPELEKARVDLKAAKEEWRTVYRAYKTATANIPKFEKSLEILNKNIGGA